MSRTRHHVPWWKERHPLWTQRGRRRYPTFYGHAPAWFRRMLNRLQRTKLKAAISRDPDDPMPRGRWRRVANYDYF